jgi:hypothetical protein
MKIGDKVEYGGHDFLVTDIQCNENLEGRVLYIKACDREMADKTQRGVLANDAMREKMIEFLRKIGGGEFNIGGIGFV